MIDYSKWKQLTKSATSLVLDPRNPRLLPREKLPTQIELIAELVQHENVYELAKKISERGFWRIEMPIAVEEDGKLVVVEGNRRVAALKLLISPDLAPERERAKFKKLSAKTTLSQIKTLVVIVAPSREAAAPVILSKHTSTEVEGWSPVMQARFYADRLEDGVSVADLAKEYSIPQGQIQAFLQNYQIYQIACSLPLAPDIAEKVKDPREFPLTTLERVYRNSEAASFLGISFDAQKHIRITLPKDQFEKAFSKVVIDVAKGDINSRNLNSSEEFSAYLSSFGESTPQKNQESILTTKDFVAQPPSSVPLVQRASVLKATLPARSAQQSTALVPRSFSAQSPDARINQVIRELKKLSIKEYPNAVALSLRTLIDLAVGAYCDKIGATALIIERAKKKHAKEDDWYPSVRQMLNFIVSEQKAIAHPLAFKAAQMLVADNKPLTILTLDAFAHNKFVTPTESELRSFWTQIEEGMRVIVTQEQPQSTPINGQSK